MEASFAAWDNMDFDIVLLFPSNIGFAVDMYVDGCHADVDNSVLRPFDFDVYVAAGHADVDNAVVEFLAYAAQTETVAHPDSAFVHRPRDDCRLPVAPFRQSSFCIRPIKID